MVHRSAFSHSGELQDNLYGLRADPGWVYVLRPHRILLDSPWIRRNVCNHHLLWGTLPDHWLLEPLVSAVAGNSRVSVVWWAHTEKKILDDLTM